MEDIYYAHISEDGRRQTVNEHLRGTAILAQKFSERFEAGEQGYLTGALHDIGKYSKAFQKRLFGGVKVDHSTAGAFECYKANQPAAAFCIAGHHSGLPNGGTMADLEGSTLFARINNASKLEAYNFWKKEQEFPEAKMPTYCRDSLSAAFFTRMLYSCLVDADYLDTEMFMTNHRRQEVRADMGLLDQRLGDYIKPWFPPTNEINKKRCEILEECLEAGSNEKGIYSLTVPTGGGKTVASAAFAVKHAYSHKMSRIIYVIPYTSIIEQTAAIFRKIFGEEQILEHHSDVDYKNLEEISPEYSKIMQMTENWDAPIVITTAVQFFESLYSNRTSKCRKLHNIADSVIIFDEAQMMPLPLLKPCVYAISELVKNYGATAVLCTATQPSLNPFFKDFFPDADIRELCPESLYETSVFKRVSFRFEETELSFDDVAEEMNRHNQVLCIVNSRKSAQEIYDNLEKDGAYHLSTLMYPEHRKAVLEEIRIRLKNGRTCRVVSTSLIEAGIDIDFPVVMREEAGLDSILQAAGRCNREGRREANESIVKIFKSDRTCSPHFASQVSAFRASLRDYGEDISGKNAVKRYFEELYDLKGNESLDKYGILTMLKEDNFPFKTVSEYFRMIDTETKTIYIPINNGRLLIEKLLRGEGGKKLYRELGKYGVSIYEQHFDALVSGGYAQLYDEGIAVLTDISIYDSKKGLSIEADSGKALFI